MQRLLQQTATVLEMIILGCELYIGLYDKLYKTL